MSITSIHNVNKLFWKGISDSGPIADTMTVEGNLNLMKTMKFILRFDPIR